MVFVEVSHNVRIGFRRQITGICRNIIQVSPPSPPLHSSRWRQQHILIPPKPLTLWRFPVGWKHRCHNCSRWFTYRVFLGGGLGVSSPSSWSSQGTTFLSRTTHSTRFPKLMTTLYNKEKYIIHYRNRKQALKNGLVLKKVHSIFNQTTWLKSFIDLNTTLRAQARNDFEVNLFKLMIDAFFENIVMLI